MLVFLYGTGSRINEMLALKVEDVDLTGGTVKFRTRFASRTRVIPDLFDQVPPLIIIVETPNPMK